MVIIGGGPAGITAAIYALRANKKVLIIEKEVIGGKIVSSPLIENYPGIIQTKGAELSESLYEQIKQLGGEIKFQEATGILEKGERKEVITTKESYPCYTVVIATGTKYRKLGINKEEDFIGKGISFCAVCDGFFYREKLVAVVGGGNTAVANALELSNVCQKVYIFQILDHLTAEPILTEQLKNKENIEIWYQTSIRELIGKEKLTGVTVEKQGQKKTIEIDGLFLAIGQLPENDVAGKNIEKDKDGYILVDVENSTNQKGIFAAGDCVSKQIRQLTTATSEGTIAALNAIMYIDGIKK